MFAKRIIIHSPLHREEAAERLRAATVTPGSTMDLRAQEKAWFRGSVRPNGFQITPNDSGGFFQPVLKGTITAADEGSVLRAKAYPAWWIRLFFLIWNGFMTFMLLAFIIAAVVGSIPVWLVPLPLAFLGVSCGIMRVFCDPGEESEERLRKLLRAE